MRVIQALYWLRDLLHDDKERILARLVAVLEDPDHGQVIRNDVRQGLSAIPEWMQSTVRELLSRTEARGKLQTSKSKKEVGTRTSWHHGDACPRLRDSR